MPGSGLCEQCVCNAPNIVCSAINCEIKSSCKIIQKENQCCPEFLCGNIYFSDLPHSNINYSYKKFSLWVQVWGMQILDYIYFGLEIQSTLT